MSALWVYVAPSGEGGRLAAKPQMGRGLGTAETNLVAAFSWQGSHGPGGAISSNYRIPQLFKRGSLFPKLTLYQGFGEPHRSYVYVCTCIATVNNSILVAHSLSLHT